MARRNAARTNLGQQVTAATQSAQRGVLSGIDTTGKVFWGVFGALFLGMIAALGGRVGSQVGADRVGALTCSRRDR